MKTFQQFAEQAYSSKQIDEGLLSLGAKAIQYGTKYGTKAFRVVSIIFQFFNFPISPQSTENNSSVEKSVI